LLVKLYRIEKQGLAMRLGNGMSVTFFGECKKYMTAIFALHLPYNRFPFLRSSPCPSRGDAPGTIGGQIFTSYIFGVAFASHSPR